MCLRLPYRMCAVLPALLALGLNAQNDTLIRTFTAFSDTFSSGHVAMDLENDVLILARTVGESGSVRVHWRDAGGDDQWGAIAVLAEDIRGFGRSIDLHNGLLAVGIDANNGSFNGASGSVHIYRIDPWAIEPVVPLDTLLLDADDDAYPTDRFGRTVHWRDDALLVSAVGRYHPTGTGAVYIFDREGDQWQVCGSLQADSTLQAPVLGYYGEVITSSEDRIVIGAPFSGYSQTFSDLPSMSNVLGSLHFYKAGADGSSMCDWLPDGIAMDIAQGPDNGNTFATLETGRQGLAFNGTELIGHIASNYTLQEPDFDLDDEMRVGPPLRPGCAQCGLRSFNETQPGIWSIADTSMLPTQADLSLGLGAWTVHDQLLFVNRFHTAQDAWSTQVHRREDGPQGIWSELVDIPAAQADSATAYNTPLVADGPWLVRLPSTYDETGPQHTIDVEIFRLGAWTDISDAPLSPLRLLPYPNPAQGVCTLELPNGTPWSIAIIDPTGRTVRAFAPRLPDRAVIDLSGLSQGVYSIVALERGRGRRLFGTIAVEAP